MMAQVPVQQVPVQMVPTQTAVTNIPVQPVEVANVMSQQQPNETQGQSKFFAGIM